MQRVSLKSAGMLKEIPKKKNTVAKYRCRSPCFQQTAQKTSGKFEACCPKSNNVTAGWCNVSEILLIQTWSTTIGPVVAMAIPLGKEKREKFTTADTRPTSKKGFNHLEIGNLLSRLGVLNSSYAT